MKVMICVGSTCHLCGSKKVVNRVQELVAEYNVQAEVELGGKFCMGKCGEGVNVMVGEEIFSVKPEEVDEFFKKEILSRV